MQRPKRDAPRRRVWAVAVGFEDRLWSMQDFAEMIDAAAPKPGRPATYKKRKT